MYLTKPIWEINLEHSNTRRNRKGNTYKHIYVHVYVYVCIYAHTNFGSLNLLKRGFSSSWTTIRTIAIQTFLPSGLNVAELPTTTSFRTLTKVLATCFWSFSKPLQFFLAFNEIPFYFSRYDSPWTSRAYFLLELGQLMTNNDGESIDRREILGERLNESLR